MHLQRPEEYRAPPVSIPSPPKEAGPPTRPAEATRPAKGKSGLPETPPSPARPEETAPPKSEVAAPPEPRIKPEPRRFQLPPRTKAKPVPQTVVLDTVLPETVLPAQVPLPTLLVWTPPKLRPPAKQFSVPTPNRVPPAQQSLPAAPVLEAPNREIVLGTVNLAPTLLNDSSRLVHIPTTSVPVSSAGREPAKDSPQIARTTSDQPGVNVISQPNAPQPLTPSVVPPANQIAPEDRAGGGQEGAHPPVAPGSNVPGTLPGAGAAAPNGPTADRAVGTQELRGTQTSSGGALRSPGGKFAVVVQPPDGKFAVVVQGSPDSLHYPESAGVLGGRIVYTVYLRVGLRKNWILQYTLPKDARAVTGTNGTPIDPPWPLLILRPDELTTRPVYIIVHGKITEAGAFDQPSLVFPRELEKQDVLLKSLEQWKFRPALRDGEPAAIDVLLIIPRQD
ncbi:MAG TPA: hypothetical protein VIY49_32335 [Bryobacteraceae bacterium]